LAVPLPHRVSRRNRNVADLQGGRRQGYAARA